MLPDRQRNGVDINLYITAFQQLNRTLDNGKAFSPRKSNFTQPDLFNRFHIELGLVGISDRGSR